MGVSNILEYIVNAGPNNTSIYKVKLPRNGVVYQIKYKIKLKRHFHYDSDEMSLADRSHSNLWVV